MGQAAPADAIPFTISELSLRHNGVEQCAVVITPKSPMTIGRSRFEQLKKARGLSRVERWLVDQVSRRGARMILFRAVNEAGQRVWQFDPTLSEQEIEEGGTVMVQALLPLHRSWLSAGVVLIVHTDWGLRECHAMRHGARVLERDLSGRRGDPVGDADRWILKHMLLHVALGVDHITKSLLPVHLTMIERRWPRVRELLAALPKDAV